MEIEIGDLLNKREVKVTITNIKPHCRWKFYSKVIDITSAIKVIETNKSVALGYKFLIYADYPTNTFELYRK